MEQEKRPFQKNDNDGNYHSQRGPQSKYNKSSNNLEVPRSKFSSRSNSNLKYSRDNSRENSSNSLNGKGENFENLKKNPYRSKSNVDIRNQRKKGSEPDDELNQKSRSNNQISSRNNSNRKLERIDSERNRGRSRNEENSRERDRDRGRIRNDNRSRDRNDINGNGSRERGNINGSRERNNVNGSRERNNGNGNRERNNGNGSRERNNGNGSRERNYGNGSRERNNGNGSRERNNGNNSRERNNSYRNGSRERNNINRSLSRERGDVNNNNNRDRNDSNGNKNWDRSIKSRDNIPNQKITNNENKSNNSDGIKKEQTNNQLHRYSSSSGAYKQKYQVSTSSPLAKPTHFQDPSSSSFKTTATTQSQQSSTSQTSKLRNVPFSNNSISSLTKPHLLKNDSSTSIFSEVSITSTNNHYRFTGNINNNYVGGNATSDKASDNKIQYPNIDLEVYDDNTSQNYYSSDDTMEDIRNHQKNKSENSYNTQNSIPLVERMDPPQTVQHDNVERDRYGFKISYQYISRESQLLFQKNYQPILERRKSRWNALIKENGGKLPQKISKKVKRFIHKGIPQDLRPMCWYKYSGAEEMQETFPYLYKYLLETEIDDKRKGKFSTPSKMGKSIEEIEKDLYRTFPDNEKFITDPPTQDEIGNNKNDPNAIREIKNPYIRSLRNILVAFSYYSIDPIQGGATSDRHSKYTIGYCQSLNYIAGLLLLIFADSKDVKFPEESFKVEEKCFWMMIALVDEILPIELYEETQMHGAQIEQDVLWDNLVGENGRKFGLSAVAEWVAYMERGEVIHSRSKYAHWNTGGSMPALKSITLPWMLTCFVGVLPIETVLRVWDCLFTEGSKILIRVILTLFRIFKDDITSISDGMVAWTFIKNMPHRIINCHEFMEICFRPIIYINNPVSMHSSDNEDEELNQIMSTCTLQTMEDSENPSTFKSYSSLNTLDSFEQKSKPFYRMNFKKRGVGNISQKSIDKFRKIQWDKEKEHNKKH